MYSKWILNPLNFKKHRGRTCPVLKRIANKCPCSEVNRKVTKKPRKAGQKSAIGFDLEGGGEREEEYRCGRGAKDNRWKDGGGGEKIKLLREIWDVI